MFKAYFLNELPITHVCVHGRCLEGKFVDIVVGGEAYQACKVNAFIPKIGYVSIVIEGNNQGYASSLRRPKRLQPRRDHPACDPWDR